MQKLTLLVVCAAVVASGCSRAWAGEKRALGTLVVSDGGSTNNAETGYLDGVAGNRGAFRLETSTHYTIQCDTAAHFSTDTRNTDAGVGVKLAIDQAMPISTQTGPVVIKPTVDGGTYSGGLIAISATAGQTSAVCKVFPLAGNE